MNTKIDTSLYRDAFRQYKEWNEAELIEQMHNAGTISPQRKVQQYFELMVFCRKLNPNQSEWQRSEKMASLERYYESVRKLEEWRRQHA